MELLRLVAKQIFLMEYFLSKAWAMEVSWDESLRRVSRSSCDRYSLCDTMALFRLNFNLKAKNKYQKRNKQGTLRLYFQVSQYLPIKLLF